MKVLLGLIFFWEFDWFWLRLEIIKFIFYFYFEVILVGRDKKNNKIVTKMPRNMFNRCQEIWPIHMNMFKCSYNFPENVDKNMKLWTKIRNYGQTFRVYLWTFKWTKKCSYNFSENVDKNMKLWTNISSLLMNIQVNPKSVDNYSLSLDNIVHIFWKIVWTFESTHEHSSEPRKCGQLFFKFGQYCPYLWVHLNFHECS